MLEPQPQPDPPSGRFGPPAGHELREEARLEDLRLPAPPESVAASPAEQARKLHHDAVFVDIHAHPSLITNLFGSELYKCRNVGRFVYPFGLRNNLPSLKAGGVDVLLSSVYVPERSLRDNCWPIKALCKVWPHLYRTFASEPDLMTNQTLDNFELAVAKACQALGPVAEIARSKADLRRSLRDGKISIVHTIEGAHSLNGKLDNVDRFFERGVCMLTLAHFFDNGVSAAVEEGIPKNTALRFLRLVRTPNELDKGLSPFGRDVLERMIELGMIADLTHATPKARAEALDQNAGRRPLVISHVGVKDLAPLPINPDRGEIRRIADCGGLLGVIAMNYYLRGKDTGKGLDNMLETIKLMIKYGGEDCVAIGSDLDGFTHPPKDLREPADFPKLTERMLKDLPIGTVEKILGKNMLRVLDSGWGR